MSSKVEQRREELAERVSRSLEEGIIPWQKKGLPDAPVQSVVSGRNYTGLNALYLMERCAEQGYTDPRFITMSEANKQGLQVKKGEHGVALEHWKADADGKMKSYGYFVFNAQQLSGKLSGLPTSEQENKQKYDTERVTAMLKNAGMDLPPGSGLKEFREAIKALAVKNAEEAGLHQFVPKQELMALRYSIASAMVMREIGIPVEQAENAPTKSWADSIKRNPRELAKAARDGTLIAGAVLGDMRRQQNQQTQENSQEHDSELFRARQEQAEAQKGQELVAEAAAIPRGLDSNLPNADLSGTQEAVIAASAKAAEQVNELRASASSHEANAGFDKLAEARSVAAKKLGSGAIVTSAQPGKTYQGKIIGILADGTKPDVAAIQAISDNQAILHDIKDLSAESNIKMGEEVSLTADEQGYSAVQNVETKKHQREGRKR